MGNNLFENGINAGIYAARGDGANAVLSLASMIPFVGAFGTVGKVVNKGAKAADKASDVANAANKAGKVEFKNSISGSGKAKASDVPSWARNNPNGRPYTTENGKAFSERKMNEQYGKGNWENNSKRMTEYSQLKKWGDRGV